MFLCGTNKIVSSSSVFFFFFSLYLGVANVLCVQGSRCLHGDEGQDLEEMVLHNVTHDAKLVKVAATALGTNLFLESDLDVVDVGAVPAGAKDLVGESEDHDVLDHLLAQVVVNAVDLE